MDEPDEMLLDPDVTPAAAEAGELRKLPEASARVSEAHGLLYAAAFRRLQIRPDKHAEFYNGVVRVIRNKHHAQIKRGSDSSFKFISERLLRAFGYIVWVPNSDWLLPDDQLADGEVKLLYSRPKARQKVEDLPGNAVFFPIIEPLWRQMRDILFQRKEPTSRRRGRPSAAATRATSSSSAPPSETDSRVEDWAVESEEARAARTEQAHARARAEARSRVEDLAASRMSPDSTNSSRHLWTFDETNEAIVDLIVRVAAVRDRSDPATFAQLWFEHMLRTDEEDDRANEPETETDSDDVMETIETPGDDDEDGNTDDEDGNTDDEDGNTDDEDLENDDDHNDHNNHNHNHNQNQTQTETMMTTTLNTATDRGQDDLDNALLTPQQRLTQGVSKSNEPWLTHGNPTGLQPGFPPTLPSKMSVWISVTQTPSVSTGSAAAPSASQQAYHWLSAPVENLEMASFFTGVNYRHGVPASRILGYVLSYGWNDACRFVSTGAMTTTAATPAATTTTPAVDFLDWQWQVVGLGWRDFQADLRHAAINGVRVWRMKVAVVASPA